MKKAGLFALLGFTGVTSCNQPQVGDQLVEYGCPTADYKVLGTVKDSAGKPIKGIQVVTEETFRDKSVLRDTTYSDANGNFSLQKSDFPLERTLNVIFNDVDGVENGGEFESKTVSEVEYKQDKKGSGWYHGSFTAEDNAQLDKKASE